MMAIKNQEMIQFELPLSRNDENQHLARVALEHYLYVDGWLLSDLLLDVQERYQMGIDVMLECVNGNPIGVITVERTSRECMVFVKPEHRRKGIGRRLVERAKMRHGDITSYGEGEEGSLEFFEETL